ncbi:MAG: hypothetical protein CMJ98_08970 [Planctomycetes bacterium]|jgi:hypothetical protein|nr:hypothetical protein [Planctomycetota bacterium]
MLAFLEQSADVERLLGEGDVEGAMATTVLACTHESGEEPPWLRDARSNLLGSALVCLSALHIADEQMLGLTALHGLLDRRLFNWINNGDGRIEVVLFPTLFSAGESLYDGGCDADWQRGVRDFLRVSGPFPEAYSKWLSEQAQAVDAEKQRRITDIASLQAFRIGMCVRAVGLQTARHLNGQLGVITSKRGERRGVIFESGVKAVKTQNLSPVALTCVAVGRCEDKPTARSACGEASQARTSARTGDFRAALAWAEAEGFDRPDILARVRFLKKSREMMPSCGDTMVPEKSRNKQLRLMARLRPPCVGVGAVDLATLKGQSCREWLVSGLCGPCQQAFLA